jgi:glycyl-tRNA synthetase beta chain
MDSLLLEIGTEEIPAGYIAPALDWLEKTLSQRLVALRIDCGKIRTYGTPRRLAVLAQSVAARQKPLESLVLGPPSKVAFGGDGKVAIPGEKFAQKVGVGLDALFVHTTEKGQYAAAIVKEKGLPTVEVLKKLLPELIGQIPFPKSMRWAALPLSFARPVTSLCALYGKRVIPFEFNTIKSSRFVWGHFFLSGKKISLPHADDYAKTLEKAFVTADIEKRRTSIAGQVEAAAAKMGGKPVGDDGLLDTVANLVESPFAVVGSFDPVFLEVPEPVLVTAMAQHQKYFALKNEKGDLLPGFVAINNTKVKDPGFSAKGHERVLRARLADAKFFFDADKNAGFEKWLERLSGIMFEARLGTVANKTARIEKLAGWLAQNAAPGDNALKQTTQRAAELCKADLASQVVYEFTTLQGVMGRIYAGIFGESPDVADAIEEHYRPVRAGGLLPQTPAGALLALADKFDTLCGCFAVGLIPTGASDSYALRRQTIGIVQILLDKNLAISVEAAVDEALKNVYEHLDKSSKLQKLPAREETRAKILAFVRDRAKNLLVESGCARDTTAAAIAVSIDDVPLLWKRAKAIERLKSLPDFEPLAVAFKRVVNILRQAAEKGMEISKDGPKESLFEKDCEKELLAAVGRVRIKTEALMAKGDVEAALLEVASLRQPVDRFFEDVMIMAEDLQVRNNRLALLNAISGLFAGIADFSEIA